MLEHLNVRFALLDIFLVQILPLVLLVHQVNILELDLPSVALVSQANFHLQQLRLVQSVQEVNIQMLELDFVISVYQESIQIQDPHRVRHVWLDIIQALEPRLAIFVKQDYGQMQALKIVPSVQTGLFHLRQLRHLPWLASTAHKAIFQRMHRLIVRYVWPGLIHLEEPPSVKNALQGKLQKRELQLVLRNLVV